MGNRLPPGLTTSASLPSTEVAVPTPPKIVSLSCGPLPIGLRLSDPPWSHLPLRKSYISGPEPSLRHEQVSTVHPGWSGVNTGPLLSRLWMDTQVLRHGRQSCPTHLCAQGSHKQLFESLHSSLPFGAEFLLWTSPTLDSGSLGTFPKFPSIV